MNKKRGNKMTFQTLITQLMCLKTYKKLKNFQQLNVIKMKK